MKVKDKKTFLFFLGHPAHFHLFKNIISGLSEKGHKVVVLIKTKDILDDLCSDSGIETHNIYSTERGKGKFAIIKSFYYKYLRIGKVIRKERPNILIGSEPTLPHLGKLFGIPSIVFSEDDVEIIPQFAKIAYPFVDVIMSPITCNVGKWNVKKVAYDGFQKLAYLHPSIFKPDRSKVAILGNRDYFIIRLTNLIAYHDTGRTGINREVLYRIIEMLKPYGQVFITAERKLDSEFEKYRININPSIIHHVLYYAKMYIGDSQSMAVEAALLGTPGIRFNDFTNDIGVLNELEQVYKLTTSIHTDRIEELYDSIRKHLTDNKLKDIYRKRALQMLKKKINAPSFFMWFIENYPNSNQIMKENPDYQYRFK